MADLYRQAQRELSRESLRAALQVGAFRFFRATLDRFDLTQRWDALKAATYVQLARQWCRDNGIQFTE
ncbi:hypothetical protein [Lacticaseibacillus daqingensis]|uniref:hypothetical protein n=1 Tax=Lacticaseibacillus daqingensis TaxID=2486014 RepID=UPI000F7B0253|nr:hypothetical protein [Lacticaseibacillus daqingensis]